MMTAASMLLQTWSNYYVIVGSSAGALTGLQFVVMALIAETQPKTSADPISAYGTPTIVHFCEVLLISAILSAPWPNLVPAGIALVLTGSFGVGYGAVVARRAFTQRDYRPVFEDWMWHSVIPISANVVILGGAAILFSRTTVGFFAIAVGALALLFVGIHNAWDTVTFLVTKKMGDR